MECELYFKKSVIKKYWSLLQSHLLLLCPMLILCSYIGLPFISGPSHWLFAHIILSLDNHIAHSLQVPFSMTPTLAPLLKLQYLYSWHYWSPTPCSLFKKNYISDRILTYFTYIYCLLFGSLLLPTLFSKYKFNGVGFVLFTGWPQMVRTVPSTEWILSKYLLSQILLNEEVIQISRCN